MNKETKQLNMVLVAIVVIGITVPFMKSNMERQVQAVHINVDNMEVTQDIYRAVYVASLTCDLNDKLRVAMDDEKLTYAEAIEIGDVCEVQALEQATQPFERGMLKEQLKYIKNKGVAM